MGKDFYSARPPQDPSRETRSSSILEAPISVPDFGKTLVNKGIPPEEWNHAITLFIPRSKSPRILHLMTNVFSGLSPTHYRMLMAATKARYPHVSIYDKRTIVPHTEFNRFHDLPYNADETDDLIRVGIFPPEVRLHMLRTAEAFIPSDRSRIFRDELLHRPTAHTFFQLDRVFSDADFSELYTDAQTTTDLQLLFQDAELRKERAPIVQEALRSGRPVVAGRTLMLLWDPEQEPLPRELLKQAIKEVKTCDEMGLYADADALLEPLLDHDIRFDPAFVRRIQLRATEEHERRETRVPREVRYGSGERIRVEDALTRFYVSNLFDFETDQMLHAFAQKEEGREESNLSSHRRRFAASIERTRKEHRAQVEEMHAWIREYLLDAVMSEITHQDFVENSAALLSPPVEVRPVYKTPTFIYHREHETTETCRPADTFLRLGTSEEIRSYLRAASIRFLEPGWAHLFGGEPWAEIARTAEILWRTDTPNVPYLDHVFDLQHNNASVFDKRPERVLQHDEKLKQMLDIKRDAQTMDELAERLLAVEDLPESTRDWLSATYALFRELRTQYNRLAASYGMELRPEPTDADRARWFAPPTQPLGVDGVYDPTEFDLGEDVD